MTLNVFRDRTSYLSRVFLLSMFIPFICVFLGRLGKDQTSVQDRIGLLYQSTQVPPFVAALNAIGLCKWWLFVNLYCQKHFRQYNKMLQFVHIIYDDRSMLKIIIFVVKLLFVRSYLDRSTVVKQNRRAFGTSYDHLPITC